MTAHVVVKIVSLSELERIITIIYYRLVLRTHHFEDWSKV